MCSVSSWSKPQFLFTVPMNRIEKQAAASSSEVWLHSKAENQCVSAWTSCVHEIVPTSAARKSENSVGTAGPTGSGTSLNHCGTSNILGTKNYKL